jgi:hypothetical protein
MEVTVKRIGGIVAACMLCATTAWSALPTIDVRVGVDAATLGGDIDQLFEPELRLGFTGGLHVTLPLSPVFGLESGVDWRMKGARSEIEETLTNGNVITYELDMDLRYVEVPLLVTVLPMPASPVRPVIALGAAFGFPVSGEARFSDLTSIPDQDLKDDMQAVDIGVQVGGGLLFPMGTRSGRVDLRYTHGVSDLYDIENNLESMNRAFSLTIGMTF